MTHEPGRARAVRGWSQVGVGFVCFLVLLTVPAARVLAADMPSGNSGVAVAAKMGNAAPIAASQEAPSDSSSGDNPPARAARISYLKGNVSFLRAGLDQWSEAALNFTVTTGDRLYTEMNSWAELEAGPYTVRVSHNTDLTVTNLTDQTMRLGSEQGAVRISVYELAADNTVEVDTPNGAVNLLRAGNYRVDVDADGEHSFVTVDSGSV
jgi:hypothetical protein